MEAHLHGEQGAAAGAGFVFAVSSLTLANPLTPWLEGKGEDTKIKPTQQRHLQG